MSGGGPEEVAARRRAVRLLRRVEVALAALAAAVVVAIMLLLPADPSQDQVTAAIVGVLVTLGVQVAAAVRVLWTDVTRPWSRKARRAVPLRAWFVTAASPVVGLLALAPWIAGGTFSPVPPDPPESPWATGGMLFLVLMLGAGLGLLAVPAVVAPVELAVRGVVRLVRHRGDPARRRSALGYLHGAVMLGSLTAFVLVVSAGVTFTGTGRGAWGSIVLALLGIPGDYVVVRPVALWTGRAMILALLGWLVLGWVQRVRRRAVVRRSNTASNAG